MLVEVYISTNHIGLYEKYGCEFKVEMETMNIVNTQMYIDGYQVKLVSDTSYGSLWEVSFTLKEF